jgi:hypothetical protein
MPTLFLSIGSPGKACLEPAAPPGGLFRLAAAAGVAGRLLHGFRSSFGLNGDGLPGLAGGMGKGLSPALYDAPNAPIFFIRPLADVPADGEGLAQEFPDAVVGADLGAEDNGPGFLDIRETLLP